MSEGSKFTVLVRKLETRISREKERERERGV